MDSETFEHAGLTVEITPDYEAESPREYGTLGRLVMMQDGDYKGSRDQRQEQIAMAFNLNAKDNAVVLPVFRYEHSCVILSTESFHGRAPHAEWDSALTGVIYAPNALIRDWFKVSRVTDKVRQRARKVLTKEVELYGRYLNGECYIVQVLDDTGEEYMESYSVIGYNEAIDIGKEMAEEIVRYADKEDAA